MMCMLRAGAGGLPEEVQPDMLQDDEFLRAFHHALLEASSWATFCCAPRPAVFAPPNTHPNCSA